MRGPPRSRASSTPPATISTAPTISAQLTGSPRKISAIVTEASGAEPSTTDARDAPASRIAQCDEQLADARLHQAGEEERPGGAGVHAACGASARP